jgi:hypothetical protein
LEESVDLGLLEPLVRVEGLPQGKNSIDVTGNSLAVEDGTDGMDLPMVKPKHRIK